ncbi:SDR family NAD(P)-dependent oxidoreductase [Nocardia arthritidis]|uniref:SDR family oxidoreductase n=1 Tax=Nocardia arthritidis TaxID=228602 RepID=A0A6G9YHE8_9NOCA|nr:SDR family oxidoreductase [Nocardia arthritidis]QIS12669.1 SDR family oxidoreductase [Nocardia arthritidis]
MTRTVLVTGGGTGIGYAVADRFSGEGDEVYITGRRKEILQECAAALGDNVHPLPCDNTDPDQLAAAVADLPDRIDVLVNNAGGNTDFTATPRDGLRALADRWLANLNSNVLSAVLTTHAVGDRLATGGSVVHIGSIAADQGAGSYGAAKAAVAAWNVDLARELGPRGITSNVVSPGYIQDTEFFHDKLTADRIDYLISRTMTGRAGAPSDIAETIHFLASPGARHITGQVINVNGGAFTSR